MRLTKRIKTAIRKLELENTNYKLRIIHHPKNTKETIRSIDMKALIESNNEKIYLLENILDKRRFKANILGK